MTEPSKSESGVQPYPLTFVPVLLEKVWGGDRLSRFGKPVAAGARIGESWELADLAATSASGAGGGAVRSVVDAGPMKGRTLRDVVGAWGADLVGGARPAADGGFPLLIKFLDARENLSVQVHPSPAYAASHPDAHLKTECWYILDAEPGAVIYKGVKDGVTRERFAAALQEGDGRGVVDLMVAAPAVPGECHTLPSGTVHALGAGVLVAEVQTPSDTTFRVYDWGRQGRELHIEQSLACIAWGPAPSPRARMAGQMGMRLVDNEFFSVDEIALPDRGRMMVTAPTAAPVVVMVVRGAVTLEGAEETELELGRTCLVPAAVAEGIKIVARGEAGVLVVRGK